MAGLARVVALAVLAACRVTGAVAPTGGGLVTMPDLVGMSPDQAAAQVQAAGFRQPPESSRPLECEPAPVVPEGRIACQDPAAGAQVQPYVLVQYRTYQPTRIAGAIVRAQLESLRGLPIDAARARARQLGHDGPVVVKPRDRFLAGCGDGTVCAASAENGAEDGLGVHDVLVLWVNPGLAIAPP
jgi:PASTA domain